MTSIISISFMIPFTYCPCTGLNSSIVFISWFLCTIFSYLHLPIEAVSWKSMISISSALFYLFNLISCYFPAPVPWSSQSYFFSSYFSLPPVNHLSLLDVIWAFIFVVKIWKTCIKFLGSYRIWKNSNLLQISF